MSSDYELFDRNQHNLPNFSSRDGMNNFLPNTQAPLSYNNPMDQQSVPSKNPNIQRSVIHHIVSSLGPNKTGSYSPFGETIINNNAMPVHEPNVFINTPQPSMSSVPVRHTNLPLFNDNSVDEHVVRAPNESSMPPANNHSSPPVLHVKKPRIVAEVKPMRMSYSDVVSKNAVNGQDSATPSAGSTNSASSSPNTTLPITSKSVKPDKSKFSSGSFEKKLQDGEKDNQAKTKKSPINSSVNSPTSGLPNDPKKLANTIGKSDKPMSQGQSSSGKKRSTGASKDTSASGKTSLNNNGSSRTQRNRHTSDSDDDEDNSSVIDSDEDFDDVPMEFYNVRKNIYHGEHHNIEKIVTTKGSSTYKKAKPATIGSTKKAEKVQKRTVKSTSRKRQKHEVLLKLCMAWGEYIWKFIQWLLILVYDVSYLSCGIIWDRISWCYQCAAQGFETVRHELSGSPGKAAWLWMKNKWKTFDAKFDKKSRWAFWRWLFKKKQKESEQVKDYYKDGKLPKTAEEAMKSLLNCKGKDAYR